MIISAVRAGNYFEVAAQYAGVSKSVGYKWLKVGRELRAQLEAQVDVKVPVDQVVLAYQAAEPEGQQTRDSDVFDTLAHIRVVGSGHSDWLCVELVDGVERAKAVAEVRAVAQIMKAGERTWQANAWYLERTNFNRWGRRVQIQHTGDEDNPVVTQDGHKRLSREEALRKLSPADRLKVLDARRLLQSVLGGAGAQVLEDRDQEQLGRDGG